MTNQPHRPDRSRGDLPSPADRFGGHDPDGTLAHRVLTPPLLAGITGVDLATCRTFHGALFRLIDSVGESGGIIAAPPIFIGPDPDRLRAAEYWTTEHPEPAVEAIWADRGRGLRAHRVAADRIDAALSEHARGLAEATGADPRLTFGSFHGFASRLIDDVYRLDRKHQCETIVVLVDYSLAVLGSTADHIHCLGGAVVRLGEATPKRMPW